jgi:hypothetical protein
VLRVEMGYDYIYTQERIDIGVDKSEDKASSVKSRDIELNNDRVMLTLLKHQPL